MSASSAKEVVAFPKHARVERARELFREFYAACFWHLKPDLDITEETIPALVRELRRHGGRRGVLAAATLEEDGP